MKTTLTLSAVARAGTGKGAARKLRAARRIPAVIYGPDVESRALSLDAREVEHLFASISVESTLIDVVIQGDGESEVVRSLVREVQVHAFKPELLHVDFYAVRSGEVIELEVPVRLVGTPVGVKAVGGILEQLLKEIEVECLPESIPDAIEVDVSHLGIGDSIHVGDLQVPNVRILADSETTVCTVAAPTVLPVEEVAAAPAEEVREPELIRRERAEEPEAEEGSGAS
ncbi:MAG: 50S ribosomal protein L25/general stress protein Ctc [Gemmatimonadetes bacterium]|nr:50S ribosomal protein L25/general stress protein Ctc [Gemmatimonadota bacterium]